MVKRPSLSFPELEGRGRRAILRTTEEVQAEEVMLERQDAEIPDIQEASSPGSPNASNPALQSPGTPESQNAGVSARQKSGGRMSYPKATYRLRPETLDAIEEAKRLLRRTYKLRVSLEDIAEEAILAAHRDLLEHQHASILVRQFIGKPESQKTGNPKT